MKVFVFVVLAAVLTCCFAENKTFSPIGLDCSFQIKMQNKQSGFVDEYFGFRTNDEVILKILKPEDKRTFEILYRSDMKDDEGIFFMQGVPGKSCQDEQVPIEMALDELKPFTDSFVYTNETDGVQCPNSTSSDCSAFCDDAENCIIADKAGRIVQMIDGTIISYETFSHSTFDFSGVDCDGKAFSSPVNPCETGHSSSSSSASVVKSFVGLVVAAIAVCLV